MAHPHRAALLLPLLALAAGAAGAADPVSDLSVPIDVRNASGLPRYVVGGFSIGGVTQHATVRFPRPPKPRALCFAHRVRSCCGQFDAGNPTMPIFMSQVCVGCETGCPSTMPTCTPSAPFCTPSAPREFAPMVSIFNVVSFCVVSLFLCCFCVFCFLGAT